jgi:hypothetical protein
MYIFMHLCMHVIHTYIHTYIHAYIHTYIHTYIHKYIYMHIHKKKTYMCVCVCSVITGPVAARSCATARNDEEGEGKGDAG